MIARLCRCGLICGPEQRRAMAWERLPAWAGTGLTGCASSPARAGLDPDGLISLPQGGERGALNGAPVGWGQAAVGSGVGAARCGATFEFGRAGFEIGGELIESASCAEAHEAIAVRA